MRMAVMEMMAAALVVGVVVAGSMAGMVVMTGKSLLQRVSGSGRWAL